MRKSAYVKTFGCQQNEADSEKIRGILVGLGYAIADSPDGADLVAVNTCAVREHAEQRAYGYIGALKAWKTPGKTLILCGCMAAENSVKQKIKKSYPFVDILTEPAQIDDLPAMLKRNVKTTIQNYELSTDFHILRAPPPRANVTIMRGCDNFCSYCIVPHVRGRERSVASSEIISEIKELVEKGYKDITLSGQNVNSYKPDFPELLREICAINGDFWVRFMTSHPKDCSDKLLETMAESDKIARHLHLPAQSGSDKVLREMNRGYSAEKYLGLLEKARNLMPDLTITGDIMVGFPGETEEDFRQTLDLVQLARYDSLFTFLYSPRKGTPAYDMPDLPKEIKQERFERLLDVQNAISAEKHGNLVGTVQKILADGYEENNEYPYSARNSGGRLVRVRGKVKVGQFYEMRILKCNSWNLFGDMENS